MPNCDFYAMPEDAEELFRFVFSNASWQLLEAYSRCDQPLRTFDTAATALDALERNGRASFGLVLYAPEMGGRVEQRRITLNADAVPGATFRYSSEGWGLIHLQLEPARNGRLHASHTSHNTEKRARLWESTYPELTAVESWDWRAVSRVSSRLNRFIRSRAPSKSGSRPVLPVAHAAIGRGLITLDSAISPSQILSSPGRLGGSRSGPAA